jgi:surfactin synthase thioesterase subunit
MLPTAKWFVKPIPKPQAEFSLVCIPYAGGGPSIYMHWAKLLPENMELVILQLPGRAQRILEAPLSDMDLIMDSILPVFTQVIAKPYIIFGHSLGSLIGFELISRLSSFGWRLPAHFIASACRAPHVPKASIHIHDLPDNAFISEIKKLNGTPKEVLHNQELMALLLPVLRADFKLASEYLVEGRIKINCLATILTGSEDCMVNKTDITKWGELFLKRTRFETLEGDHFFIHPQVKDVIRIIAEISLRQQTCYFA